jgi:hypothetical protein
MTKPMPAGDGNSLTVANSASLTRTKRGAVRANSRNGRWAKADSLITACNGSRP